MYALIYGDKNIIIKLLIIKYKRVKKKRRRFISVATQINYDKTERKSSANRKYLLVINCKWACFYLNWLLLLIHYNYWLNY